ncbi:hypothetical protein TNIN_450741 [Trichonephila inaurata madagascariensis]|uniref:Uncharacterized protein n=1 Tax=Trichonephila inaurata madagascariensis TaxID=2747483 RepID=A0A8X6IEB6_9ARAC|nr:hypothetical protein TNIN_450741 [Trichonephila inaurata madagascariensis]
MSTVYSTMDDNNGSPQPSTSKGKKMPVDEDRDKIFTVTLPAFRYYGRRLRGKSSSTNQAPHKPSDDYVEYLGSRPIPIPTLYVEGDLFKTVIPVHRAPPPPPLSRRRTRPSEEEEDDDDEVKIVGYKRIENPRVYTVKGNLRRFQLSLDSGLFDGPES